MSIKDKHESLSFGVETILGGAFLEIKMSFLSLVTIKYTYVKVFKITFDQHLFSIIFIPTDWYFYLKIKQIIVTHEIIEPAVLE